MVTKKTDLGSGFVEFIPSKRTSDVCSIGIGKVTISFSEMFAKSYGIKVGDRVKLLYNKDKRLLAIQAPAKVGLKIVQNVKTARPTSGLFVGTTSVYKQLGIKFEKTMTITDIEEHPDNMFVVQL